MTVDLMQKSYSGNEVCCVDCGVKFMRENNLKLTDAAITANKGICCVCGQEKLIVPIRHYNYLTYQNKTQ